MKPWLKIFPKLAGRRKEEKKKKKARGKRRRKKGEEEERTQREKKETRKDISLPKSRDHYLIVTAVRRKQSSQQIDDMT